MKTKNKYTIDNQNRLVIKRNRRRIVTNGRFSIDKGNRLIYWLNENDPWRREYDLPTKISFTGRWKEAGDFLLKVRRDYPFTFESDMAKSFPLRKGRRYE